MRWEELARILRRFVAQVAKVPAGERTTQELDLLLEHTPLDRYRITLIAILKRSDHTRFARAASNIDHLHEQIDTLRRLIPPMTRACAPTAVDDEGPAGNDGNDAPPPPTREDLP